MPSYWDPGEEAHLYLMKTAKILRIDLMSI